MEHEVPRWHGNSGCVGGGVSEVGTFQTLCEVGDVLEDVKIVGVWLM